MPGKTYRGEGPGQDGWSKDLSPKNNFSLLFLTRAQPTDLRFLIDGEISLFCGEEQEAGDGEKDNQRWRIHGYTAAFQSDVILFWEGKVGMKKPSVPKQHE